MRTPRTVKPSKLQIAHHVPGRIRMKIPSAKGNPDQLAAYRDTLSLIPGIQRIEVNPDTGSIVLKYDPGQHDDFHAGLHSHARQHHHQHIPGTEIDALANKIEEEAEYLARHSAAARAVVDFCKTADRQIKLASGNMLDFKMMLALGIIGITLFEVGATAATPVWVTLTLFALHHYIEMQAERLEELEAKEAKEAERLAEAAEAAEAAETLVEAAAVIV
jgi:hypothetical protein